MDLDKLLENFDKDAISDRALPSEKNVFDEKTVNHYKKLYDYKKIHVNSCDTKSCKGHADILVHI